MTACVRKVDGNAANEKKNGKVERKQEFEEAKNQAAKNTSIKRLVFNTDTMLNIV